MHAHICPICKNKFYSENKYFDQNSVIHNYCVLSKKLEKKETKVIRTSTPVAELENTPFPSFSDSVTDFFYQSWKSGLHNDDSKICQNFATPQNHVNPVQQPVLYAPQVVYVNTVIFQPYLPAHYAPQVGYRPDGTFGAIPPYWPYNRF